MICIEFAVDTNNPLSMPPLVVAMQTGFSALVLNGVSPAGFSNIAKGGKGGLAEVLRVCAQGVLGQALASHSL